MSDLGRKKLPNFWSAIVERKFRRVDASTGGSGSKVGKSLVPFSKNEVEFSPPEFETHVGVKVRETRHSIVLAFGVQPVG